MSKLVRDLMHTGIITCKPNATLGQVAVLLDQHQVHALIVTDRDGRPNGILSDLDLMAGEWLSSDEESLKVMRSLTASDLMTQPIDTVEATVPLSEAVNLLTERARQNNVVISYTNAVGGQDELVFDGQSMVIDGSGKLIAMGRQFEEELITLDLSLPGKPSRTAAPKKLDFASIDALVLSEKAGLKKKPLAGSTPKRRLNLILCVHSGGMLLANPLRI